MLLHCTNRGGRAGPAVTWFAAHELLTTLRDLIRIRCPLSLRLHRGDRDRRTLLHCMNRGGRAGAEVTWVAAHDQLTTLHDFGGGPLGLRVRRRGRDSRTLVHCTKLWLL